MADSDNDEPGVLGNLPRSRPGRRSEKRTTGATRSPKAARTTKSSTSKASSSSGARAKRTGSATSGRKSAARPSTARKAPRSTSAPAQGSGDPLQQAVRLAGKVAETGVKTGVGILRRITGR